MEQYEFLWLFLANVREDGRRLVLGGDFNASIGPVASFEPVEVVGTGSAV